MPVLTAQRFDLRGEPVVLARGKWNPHKRRDPAAMRGVCLHAWQAKVGTTAKNRKLYGGESPALARRALEAPYTISAGVGSSGHLPVVALAHPIERYTYASDDACKDFVAVGVMGLFPFEETGRTDKHTRVTDALQAAVDQALVEAVAMLISPGPHILITHRQAINEVGDHVRCPCETVVMMTLRSPVVRTGLLVPDPDFVLDDRHGRPWPAAWRQHLREPPLSAIPTDRSYTGPESVPDDAPAVA